jgi:TRAP-type C4-dicarboxylate transport system substrate-binding protein
MKTPIRLALTLAATLAASTALAQEHSLRFQSSDPSGNPNFELQQQWTDLVEERSDGRIAIELLPVESIVAHNETQDAIAAGILDGHITDTSYFAGKDPAFGLIANPVGAWSEPEQMFVFIEEGGGRELMNEILEPYGLHFIGATTPGLEAFVSDVPIEGVDDLEGVKVRAPEGLVQEVFAAAGAAPVNLPGSEVFTSLDKGVIDAADYSVFSTNHAQGLHDVARHPVYPGFHSMPLVEISMNLEKWNALPDDLKQVMEETVSEFARMQVASLREADEAALEEARASGEITVHDWPEEERARFREIAQSEWEKVASGSENAQKVYDALTAYLRDQGMI